MSDYDDAKALFTNHEVNRLLHMYRATGNGLFIWQAYREYRKAGMEVPEGLLTKFDQFSSRLLSAKDKDQMLDALELFNNPKGGRGPNLARRDTERRQKVIDRCVVLRRLYGRGNYARAHQAVADEFGMTKGSVDTLWKNAKKPPGDW